MGKPQGDPGDMTRCPCTALGTIAPETRRSLDERRTTHWVVRVDHDRKSCFMEVQFDGGGYKTRIYQP